jgi:hypothetical protein
MSSSQQTFDLFQLITREFQKLNTHSHIGMNVFHASKQGEWCIAQFEKKLQFCSSLERSLRLNIAATDAEITDHAPKGLGWHRTRRFLLRSGTAVSTALYVHPCLPIHNCASIQKPLFIQGVRESPLLSLQLCILRLGLFQDGDVGIGGFPHPEKVFVTCEGTNACCVSLHTTRRSRL